MAAASTLARGGARRSVLAGSGRGGVRKAGRRQCEDQKRCGNETGHSYIFHETLLPGLIRSEQPIVIRFLANAIAAQCLGGSGKMLST